MFKVSRVSNLGGLEEAEQIMRRIYAENPSHWPNGLSAGHFDGGLYLIREKQSSIPAGIVGWQERIEPAKQYPFFQKIGYYSIGILPEYRRNGFAREAVSKIIHLKSAGVDRVKALIVESNKPSQALADDLGVEMEIKQASTFLKSLVSPAVRSFAKRYALPAAAGAGMSALENQFITPGLDPGLKKVNLGIGALTLGMLRSPDKAVRLLGLGGYGGKQMGLFGVNALGKGITALDKFRQQQQELVDKSLTVAETNRQTAELNKADTVERGKDLIKLLVPTLAIGGGGLGYIGYNLSQKNKKKDPIPKYDTISEKGKRRSGDKIRIDVPARSLPPEFFTSLTNVDDNPRAYTRRLQLEGGETKEANQAPASQGSIPGLFSNLADFFVPSSEIAQTGKELGHAGASYTRDDVPGVARYGASAAANALMALIALRLGGGRMLGGLLKKPFMSSVSKAVPGIARVTGRWADPKAVLQSRFRYDPTRFAWKGTPLNAGGVGNAARYGGNRLLNLGYMGKQFAGRHPYITGIPAMAPLSVAGSAGTQYDEAETAATKEYSEAARAAREQAETEREAAKPWWERWFGSKATPGAAPPGASTAPGAVPTPAPAAPVAPAAPGAIKTPGTSSAPATPGVADIKMPKGFDPSGMLDWESRQGPRGIPLSSIFAGVLNALGGPDIQHPLKDQLGSPGTLDQWQSTRSQ